MKSLCLLLVILILQSTAMATPLVQAAFATTAQATVPLLQFSDLLESISEFVFLGSIF
jgi:hypothetical protein